MIETHSLDARPLSRSAAAVTATGLLCGLLAVACSVLVDTDGFSSESRPGPEADPEAGPDAVVVDSGEPLDASPSDGGVIQDPHLVGAWSFEDSKDGVVQDESGKGNHAALFASASIVAGGIRGNAVSFVSDTDKVTVPTLDGAAFPRSGTLVLWFKYAFAPGDSLQRGLFDIWNADRSHVFVRRENGASPKAFQAAFQPAGQPYALQATFTVEPDSWLKVILSWDEAQQRGGIYLGGHPVTVGAFNVTFAPRDQFFRLGTRFLGLIDEVRLYDRAMSEDEVAALP